MNKIFHSTCFSSFSLLLVCLLTASSFLQAAAPPDREYFELRIYHLDNQQQEERIDKFLENAFLPALQRAGIEKVGVFKPADIADTTGRKIYVYIPYQSAEQYMQLPQTLDQDAQYLSAGQDYIDATHDNPPYLRMESVLMLAFEGMPQFQQPSLTNPVSERIYELRSYEGATEKLFMNKVQMFNEGEIDIFERLDFNPVFFGEVRAGCNMPNLIYMTAHADMAAREKNWKVFGADAQWKEMSAMEEYQNNVSHADIILLQATPYSGI